SKAAFGGVRAAPADGPVTFVASDETEDRMGDVIAADGWELEAYQRNPVFLWAHDYTRAPVGRAVWTGVEGRRLLASVVFAPTPFAREVETLYRQGFLRAVSVGFRAKAFAFRASSGGGEGVRFTRQELVEVSAVPVPANPSALAKAMADGLDAPRMRSLFGLGEACGPGAPEASDEVDDLRAAPVIAALRRFRGAE
ncbi:MAG: HK97 family phage prohead protease, partial [Chloroflexota bacterium]|nr:HK97 family phage prohead protease [Chloroflexota bacterium]